ncbi:hypothetical protein CLAFUW4_05906 [Fulvia fulva]|uniref:Uncharacterized protein n=1 Tax=Passalora fulva TaxID=5499 RepID=A0A9Q8LHH5_PASFU|nr:uncharacterized protein CLAFUR5_06050 [Fulvia fulva]KAK4623896.1 hypothetical protein CLAFUR4_05900 [Fulvia fulva]KAK4625696.1 hypothetical protein CLAFUR0_05913 [Fulvia fulva]UJO17493.1 hypothetical protein CLAFUR5_06050 [Fulvia fulva]WPV15076.1 hypothetical protein CLAFUW4_05906 [Fulvia fulva]WPV29516.1 hypothetical protein CLAFUW7_05904 [Fulvia fulva]
MVLWTYGMMLRNAPWTGQLKVFLDEGRSGDVETFILMGKGHVESVLATGIALFEGNYPNELQGNLPQLVRSLCELMRELVTLK